MEQKFCDHFKQTNRNNIELTPWEKLGNAVVIQAARDYEILIAKKNKNEVDKKDIRMIKKFFLGADFNRFTRLDGKMIFEKLNEKIGVKL